MMKKKKHNSYRETNTITNRPMTTITFYMPLKLQAGNDTFLKEEIYST